MFINPSRRRAYVPEWSKRRPRADNLSYAIASIRLGESELAPALWSFVTGDVTEPAPEGVLLASEWLSIFIKDKELTEHSPLFPLGVASQWERLSWRWATPSSGSRTITGPPSCSPRSPSPTSIPFKEAIKCKS